MKKAVVFRHVCFEDLGTFEALLRTKGYAVEYHEAPVAELPAIDVVTPDLLCIMGGPIGAYEDDLYPFLTPELEALSSRLRAKRPTLGICLGAQLLARVLGAKVYPGPAKEIGWAPIELSDAGRTSCLRHLGPELTHVLHWHGDTFDLPDGAVHLASTEICRNQAFSWDGCALALQFHPEVDARGLERWLVGHAVEISKTAGITVQGLRDGARQWSSRLHRQACLLLEEWLGEVGAA